MIKTKPVNHKHNCSCSVCERLRTPPSTKMLLTLPVTLHDTLRVVAFKRGISISEAVRLCIQEFLKANPVGEEEGRTLLEILSTDN